jgi:hypothetical protein
VSLFVKATGLCASAGRVGYAVFFCVSVGVDNGLTPATGGGPRL